MAVAVPLLAACGGKASTVATGATASATTAPDTIRQLSGQGKRWVIPQDFNLTNWADILTALGKALAPVWLGKQTATEAVAVAKQSLQSLLHQGQLFA